MLKRFDSAMLFPPEDRGVDTIGMDSEDCRKPDSFNQQLHSQSTIPSIILIEDL